MEEISKRAWHSAFAAPAPPAASTTELTAADREALAHVTGLLRAYYQTLLIEPTPERLLGLLDEIDERGCRAGIRARRFVRATCAPSHRNKSVV